LDETKIAIKLLRMSAIVPKKATKGASGFDIFACLGEGEDYIEIGNDPIRVPTGIAIEVPFGIDAQIRPRSGLTLKGVIGPLGTIDSDYRGEIFVTMYTLKANQNYKIQEGDRIAQIIFNHLADVDIQVTTDELTETKRGSGGFGSTGS
tara:strand:- start:12544 stop:12990 length:447 start_codon:yes stop_codon:yes gene_type:complete